MNLKFSNSSFAFFYCFI